MDQLDISSSNVRTRERMEGIDELARSMATFKLQQPIVVIAAPNGRYDILIGQRRFFAARSLGWQTIPARILTQRPEDYQAKAISFSENVQRRDIAPRDKADTCIALLDELQSVRAVAEYLGTTVQTVRKWLGYAAVPERLKALVEEDSLSVPEATRLAHYVDDEAKAVDIANRMHDMRAPKSQRRRIIAEAEVDSARTVDSIIRSANERQKEKRITVILPEKWSLALDRAANLTGQDQIDIARDAIITWLESRRY